jgi:DnaK suppressor protein
VGTVTGDAGDAIPARSVGCHSRRMGAHPNSGLTEEQLSTLTSELVKRRQQLLSRLQTQQSEARATDTDAAVMDPMDAATAEQQRSLPRLLGDADRARLAAIDEAQARIAAGTYGVSVRSEEPIGFARLLAEPWARLTADEAEALENAQRRGRHPSL